jgi:hypothetical protein
LVVSRRSSVFVLALTVGDYLLWNWSLSANQDALALASGLTLPPLALISLWIVALGTMRLLANVARRPERPSARPARRARPAQRPAAPPAEHSAAASGEESTRIAA